MNAGFSSLKALKAHLLAEKLRPDLTYDDQILSIGVGMAAAFGRYCDRDFERVVGGTYATSASDRTTFVLPRYPIEAITAIHVRNRAADTWEAQSLDIVLQTYDESGVVVFDTAIGWRGATVRFTYTGGLWWDTTEDDSGELPTGATALPADLRHAWLLQCQEIWSRRDTLGLGLTAKPTERAKLSELDLIPAVRGMLRPHIRHAS